MIRRKSRPVATKRLLRGFSLVELMIALVLGLIVIGGVISVFLSIQRSNRTNDALSQIQDGARIAFSLMARDIRQAGLAGCGDGSRVANVLSNGPNNGGSTWWANWGDALVGYDGTTADTAVAIGTGVGARVSGTDSVHVLGAQNSGGYSVDICSGCNSAQLKLNEANPNLQAGDVILVCDPDHAAIAQVTSYDSHTVTLVHNKGGSVTPGNCSKGLGYPTDCSSTNGNAYPYKQNSQISKLSAADWYIGNNPVGGRSLYEISLSGNGSAAVTQSVEMVRNVTDMRIRYHIAGKTSFVAASAVGNKWSSVDALQITLTLQSAVQRAGTDAQPLTRSLTTTVTLRNRVSS